MHGSNHGKIRTEQANRRLVQAGCPFLGDLLGVALGIEVGAGTEVLTLRAQHDRPARWIAVEGLVRFSHAADERHVEEVGRWPVDLHLGHEVSTDVDADVTELLGHKSLPLLPAALASSVDGAQG